MKHVLVGGVYAGRPVEVLYPVNELQFPPPISAPARLGSAGQSPANTEIQFVRYSRRSLTVGREELVAFVSAEMTDQQAVEAIRQ